MLRILLIILLSNLYAFSNSLSDLKIGDSISLHENCIIVFLEKTNCFVCEQGLRDIIETTNKLKLKKYLIISGQPKEITTEFSKQKQFDMICLDDSDKKYSFEFKLKESPTFFIVNFLGKVQFIGKVGSGEVTYDRIIPNRQRLTVMNSNWDYFYTVRINKDLFTYNSTNNTLLKLDSVGKILKSFIIDNSTKVVRNLFIYNNTLYTIQYSPFNGTELVTYDFELTLQRTIHVFSKDTLYGKTYSLSRDSYLNNEGKLLSSVRHFYDSIKSDVKMVEINLETGELENPFSFDDTSNDEVIFVKNFNKTCFLNSMNPKYLFVRPSYKIELSYIQKYYQSENIYSLINCFGINDKIFLLNAYCIDGYGSQLSRLNYQLVQLDAEFKPISIYNLGNIYNNYSFVFLYFKNNQICEILGRDDYGLFLEKVEF